MPGANEVRISVIAADKASAALKGIEKNVHKLTGALKLAALAGAAAMGAMAVASVKTAADFEKSMSESVALAGLLPEELDRVKKALLEMAPAMGKSPQELAEAFYFASSAGLDTEKALAAVTWSAKAAAAGLGETKVIVDAVTSVMNAYSLSADKAGRVTDTLVAAVKEGKGEPDALAMAIGKVIPVASQMGVSFEEVSASLAIMTRIGLNADEAATALRGTLNALLSPTAEATATLKAMGTSADEVRKAIKERGLASVLVEMLTALEGNDEALSKIFPEIRALTGVLATAGNQGDEYIKVLQSIQGDLGITEEAFAEASDTFAFKMGQVKASFDVLKIQIGNALLPALKDLADWFVARLPDIQRFVEDGIKNLQKALQDNKQTLKDAAAGITEVGTAFMTFGAWVISNKVVLVAALTAIGAAMIWASGPVGIAAGIVSIAAALGVLKGSASGANTEVAKLKTNMLGFPQVTIEEPYDLDKWLASEKARQRALQFTGAIMSTLEKEAQRQALARFRNIEQGLDKTTKPTPTPGAGLFDPYAGAAEAAEKISDETQAMIALASAVNASGLSWREYSNRLNVVGQFMDDFNLTAGEMVAIFRLSGLSADEFSQQLVDVENFMAEFNLTGEQMIGIFQRSGLAADQFLQRLEGLTILQQVTEDAQAAEDALNGVYNQFNNLYAKPTTEALEQRTNLDLLKLQRARLIADAGEDISKSEQRAIDAINKQIDAIQREIDVRQANEQVQKDLFEIHDKLRLGDEALKTATDWITLAMDDASAKALAMRDELFWTTLSIGVWRKEMDSWITSLSSSLGIPSFQHGGVMPYTGLAHLEKGEEVSRAGGRQGGFTNYGTVTVMVPAGSGNTLADWERWLR